MRKLLVLIPIGFLAVASIILSQSNSTNPHGELKWDCQDCHTTESWSKLRSDMAFNHDETGFSLTGAHETATCIGCHKELNFNHIGIACVDCHTDQHEGQLGLACQNCHTAQNWENKKDILELHAQKGFALTGVHAVVDCESCHRGNSNQEFAGTPMDCIDCHRIEFDATNNPSHTLAGFNSDCQQCHHTASGTWQHATYAHTANFPLTGGHRVTDCNSCHSTTYAGTATDCYACHNVDFAATNDPDHEQGGFDHDCTNCHSTSAWEPAAFDHNNFSFPLTGKHTTASCLSCHSSGYTGTPSNCYACHQSDYDATNNPDHVSANFPNDCQNCHNTSGWSPSTWDHDAQYFPIYSGAHRNQWNDCNACHVQQSNYAVFECVNCHEHSRSSMDDKHNEVNNYQYLSTACYSCHPRGSH